MFFLVVFALIIMGKLQMVSAFLLIPLFLALIADAFLSYEMKQANKIGKGGDRNA